MPFPSLYTCVICSLGVRLGFPEEGPAQCFFCPVALMFVAQSKARQACGFGCPSAVCLVPNRAVVMLQLTWRDFGEGPLDVKPVQMTNVGAGKACVYRQVFPFMLFGCSSINLGFPGSVFFLFKLLPGWSVKTTTLFVFSVVKHRNP